MTDHNGVGELAEIEQIKALKASYFRLLDDRAYVELGQLYVADAQVTTSGGASFETAAAFMAFLDGPGNRPTRTVHHAHLPEIELTSPTTARGRWSLTAYAEFVDEGGPRSVMRLGRYVDEYRKEGGSWRISAQRLTLDPLKPLRGTG